MIILKSTTKYTPIQWQGVNMYSFQSLPYYPSYSCP